MENDAGIEHENILFRFIECPAKANSVVLKWLDEK